MFIHLLLRMVCALTRFLALTIFAALPLTPINRDQWIMLKEGNSASGDYPGFEKLGITPRPLGLFLDKWMVRYRKHGRFDEQLNSTTP